MKRRRKNCVWWNLGWGARRRRGTGLGVFFGKGSKIYFHNKNCIGHGMNMAIGGPFR